VWVHVWICSRKQGTVAWISHVGNEAAMGEVLVGKPGGGCTEAGQSSGRGGWWQLAYHSMSHTGHMKEDLHPFHVAV
jgi:hypothetical protein